MLYANSINNMKMALNLPFLCSLSMKTVSTLIGEKRQSNRNFLPYCIHTVLIFLRYIVKYRSYHFSSCCIYNWADFFWFVSLPHPYTVCKVFASTKFQ